MKSFVIFILLIVTALLPAPVIMQPARASYYYASGASSFVYYSSAFDGTNDYLTRGADLTGVADGAIGLFSCWVKMDGSSNDTAFYDFIANTSSQFGIFRWNDGSVLVRGKKANTTTVLSFHSAANSCIKTTGWIHILASWDLGTAGRRYIYINGSDVTTATTFTVGETIDYAQTGWAVCSAANASEKMFALVSELYFTTPAAWYDITNSANRDKFYNSGTGKPVDLGADGSTPTGTQPLVYHHNIFSSFETNLGSGGGMTENGTIGDGGSDIP